jgi:hypothetical protein
MQSAPLEPLLHQQPLQHPAARKGKLHVQRVDPVHQFQIGVRYRTWLEIDAAPADPQQDSLTADAQLGVAINHLLRSATDRPCRARQISRHGPWPLRGRTSPAEHRSQRQPPDFRMQGLHVDDRLRLGFRRRAKHPGGAFQELIAPLLNLDRTDIKVLRQLDQGPLALDLGYSDFRLEGRACGSGGVVLPWSSPRSRQSCRRCAENPLIPAVQFS